MSAKFNPIKARKQELKSPMMTSNQPVQQFPSWRTYNDGAVGRPVSLKGIVNGKR